MGCLLEFLLLEVIFLLLFLIVLDVVLNTLEKLYWSKVSCAGEFDLFEFRGLFLVVFSFEFFIVFLLLKLL